MAAPRAGCLLRRLGAGFALGREASFLDEGVPELGECVDQYVDLVERVRELFSADLEAQADLAAAISQGELDVGPARSFLRLDVSSTKARM